MKTNSGSKKRFTLTGTGKVKRKHAYKTTMACKTTFPGHEYLLEACPASQIVIRLVKKAMSKTCTDYGSDQKSIEKRVQQAFRNSFPLEETLEYKPSEDESRHEKDRVPPQRNRSDTQNLRIHMPMYCQCLKHNFKIFTTCKDNNSTANTAIILT